MQIRFAEKQDVKQIVKLCKLHATYEKTAFDITNKEELLSKHLFDCSNNIKCLVVENDNKIVGYATFIKQFSTWDANFYIYLDCLYFRETFRGKGLGTEIMNKIKEYAISENCKIIQWQTPDFNEKAITFYQKLGAESKTKERFSWKP
ncbi:MAG: N-acetyltransferase family protein [Polaribacter sp.]